MLDRVVRAAGQQSCGGRPEPGVGSSDCPICVSRLQGEVTHRLSPLTMSVRNSKPGVGGAFPPLSLRLTLGCARRAGTGGDAGGRRKLSTGRLCTSRAITGTRWGRDGTREEMPVRPVKSPALPTQVRILSLPHQRPERELGSGRTCCCPWPTSSGGTPSVPTATCRSARRTWTGSRPAGSRSAGPTPKPPCACRPVQRCSPAGWPTATTCSTTGKGSPSATPGAFRLSSASGPEVAELQVQLGACLQPRGEAM